MTSEVDPLTAELLAAATDPDHFLSERQFNASQRWYARLLYRLYEMSGWPVAVVFLFYGANIHPAYRMTWFRRFHLGWRMYRNGIVSPTLSSYKSHLAMAVKLLTIPPEVEGVVVECGCFNGGSAANLSLVCDIVDRKLVLYDSFEGMPEPDPDDALGRAWAPGVLGRSEQRVTETLRRYGKLDRCELRKGWFDDTLPRHTEPIVLINLDVDYQASQHACILNLWPHLAPIGYLFMDDYCEPDMCALFFSERYWQKYFQRDPPGLIGTGTGIGIGEYFFGWCAGLDPPSGLQAAKSTAYTRKILRSAWKYYPDERTED